MNGARGWLLGAGAVAALFGSVIAMVVGGEDAGRGTSAPASSASGGNAAADVSGLSANGTTLSFPRLSSGQFGIRISTGATGSSTGYADQPVRLLTCSMAECDGDATGAGDESNPRATTTQDAVGGGYDYAQTFELRDAPAPYDTNSPSTSMQMKNNAARGSKLTGWGS